MKKSRSATASISISLVVFTILGLGLWAAATPAAAARLQVSLEPATVRSGEPMVLTVEIWGEDLGFSAPETDLQLDNLQEVAGPFISRRTRFAAGVPVRSFMLIWRLEAGSIGYGSATATAVFGRRRLEAPPRRTHIVADDLAPPTPQSLLAAAPTDPRAEPPAGAPLTSGAPETLSPPLTAVPGPAPPTRGRTTDPATPNATRFADAADPPPRDAVRLVARVHPKSAWVGEPVTYTLFLDYLTDVRSIRPSGLPAFRGFWVRDVSVAQRSPVTLPGGGRPYLRRALLERVLIPLEAGTLTVDEAAAEMVVVLPQGGREVRRVSRPLEVQIKALPENAPEGFTGAVGSFDLKLRIAPHQLPAGSAAEVVAELSGRGYLETLTDPLLAPPPGTTLTLLERRAPEPHATSAIRASDTRRLWRWSLLPQNPGTITLPEVSVPYFDPRTGRYRMARATAPPLTVTAPSSTPSRVEDFGLASAASSDAHAASGPASAGSDRWRWAAALLAVALGIGVVLIARLPTARRRRLLRRVKTRIARLRHPRRSSLPRKGPPRKGPSRNH